MKFSKQFIKTLSAFFVAVFIFSTSYVNAQVALPPTPLSETTGPKVVSETTGPKVSSDTVSIDEQGFGAAIADITIIPPFSTTPPPTPSTSYPLCTGQFVYSLTPPGVMKLEKFPWDAGFTWKSLSPGNYDIPREFIDYDIYVSIPIYPYGGRMFYHDIELNNVSQPELTLINAWSSGSSDPVKVYIRTGARCVNRPGDNPRREVSEWLEYEFNLVIRKEAPTLHLHESGRTDADVTHTWDDYEGPMPSAITLTDYSLQFRKNGTLYLEGYPYLILLTNDMTTTSHSTSLQQIRNFEEEMDGYPSDHDGGDFILSHAWVTPFGKVYKRSEVVYFFH